MELLVFLFLAVICASTCFVVHQIELTATDSAWKGFGVALLYMFAAIAGFCAAIVGGFMLLPHLV